LLLVVDAMIPCPPKQANLSPSHGPSLSMNPTTIDGHFDTLTSPTHGQQSKMSLVGTNPKANDEVAQILSFPLKELFPKVESLECFTLNKIL